jgi:hypothetical protein
VATELERVRQTLDEVRLRVATAEETLAADCDEGMLYMMMSGVKELLGEIDATLKRIEGSGATA